MLKIGSSTQKHLGILGLSFPFSEDELKAAFRKLCLKVHPDQGGSQEEFIKVKEAYDWLLNLAVESVKKGENSNSIDDEEFGKGLGSLVNGVKCSYCTGKGFTFRVEQIYETVPCTVCRPVCNRCQGTKRWIDAKGKDKGFCPQCKGVGWKSNRASKMFEVFGMCVMCLGTGYLRHPVGKQITKRERCYKCSGAGEIRIYNPVFQKGAMR